MKRICTIITTIGIALSCSIASTSWASQAVKKCADDYHAATKDLKNPPNPDIEMDTSTADSHFYKMRLSWKAAEKALKGSRWNQVRLLLREKRDNASYHVDLWEKNDKPRTQTWLQTRDKYKAVLAGREKKLKDATDHLHASVKYKAWLRASERYNAATAQVNYSICIHEAGGDGSR
jgi:hypothetical protein